MTNSKSYDYDSLKTFTGLKFKAKYLTKERFIVEADLLDSSSGKFQLI
jgi:hypothetical protein